MAKIGPLERIETTLFELEPIFKLSDNIHKHTGKIGASCRALHDIECSLNLPEISLDTVISEIKELSKNDNSVQLVLSKIKEQGIAIERETGLNLQTLLKSTWQLAKIANYSNAEELVIDNLKQNILTKGGCAAGISARLVLPYLHFLQSATEQRDLSSRFSGHDSHQLSIDDDIELAIALSLSGASVTPVRFSTPKMESRDIAISHDISEDDQLAIALALSMKFQ